MSYLNSISIATDTGLVVLIWIVQLIIYPSFLFYGKTKLLNWHKIYTKRITLIVLPLMLSQLFIYSYYIVMNLNFANTVNFTLMSFTWLSTLLIYVPIHQKIDYNSATLKDLKRLIKLNWLRTIIWTVILINHFL